MVGLGRMGANIVRRLLRGGHHCVVYDVNEAAVRELVGEGATGASSLAEFAAALDTPRAAWIMIPTALTGRVVKQLAEHFEPGDIIIDGGNSYYRDDIDRARALAPSGIHYVDVGTSGGVWGLERGYCLMIGGDPDPIDTSTRSSGRSRRAWRPRAALLAATASTVPPSTATCTAVRPARATS